MDYHNSKRPKPPYDETANADELNAPLETDSTAPMPQIPFNPIMPSGAGKPGMLITHDESGEVIYVPQMFFGLIHKAVLRAAESDGNVIARTTHTLIAIECAHPGMIKPRSQAKGGGHPWFKHITEAACFVRTDSLWLFAAKVPGYLNAHQPTTQVPLPDPGWETGVEFEGRDGETVTMIHRDYCRPFLDMLKHGKPDDSLDAMILQLKAKHPGAVKIRPITAADKEAFKQTGGTFISQEQFEALLADKFHEACDKDFEENCLPEIIKSELKAEQEREKAARMVETICPWCMTVLTVDANHPGVLCGHCNEKFIFKPDSLVHEQWLHTKSQLAKANHLVNVACPHCTKAVQIPKNQLYKEVACNGCGKSYDALAASFGLAPDGMTPFGPVEHKTAKPIQSFGLQVGGIPFNPQAPKTIPVQGGISATQLLVESQAVYMETCRIQGREALSFKFVFMCDDPHPRSTLVLIENGREKLTSPLELQGWLELEQISHGLPVGIQHIHPSVIQQVTGQPLNPDSKNEQE